MLLPKRDRTVKYRQGADSINVQRPGIGKRPRENQRILLNDAAADVELCTVKDRAVGESQEKPVLLRETGIDHAAHILPGHSFIL